MTKKEVRDTIRSMRREVESEDASYAKDLLAELFFEIPDDRLEDLKGACVGLYMPFDGELDVTGLAGELLSRGASLAFPSVEGDRIVFRSADIGSKDQFCRGAYIILEPRSDLMPAEPDIIIVPGVAYNDEGIRLGMGGGFYDKYYKDHPDALYIGVCYAFQVVSDLPFDEDDMACDILIPVDTGYDDDDTEGEDEI